MTILLYNRVDLHERTQTRYRLWKGCHITTYVLAAVFGILNCYLLFTLCKMFSGRCVLSPNYLVFTAPRERVEPTTTRATEKEPTTTKEPEWRISGPPILDIEESRFHIWSYCNVPLSIPLLSAAVALVWTAMFCVCPSGGRSRRGLDEPWRIVTPALAFSVAFAALTGHNFLHTDRGLREFCEQFQNVTNATSCSRSIDAYVAPSELSPSLVVVLCRAACSAGFACWLVATALLLARCVSGVDFQAHTTAVQLHPPKLKSTPPLQRPRKRPDRIQIQIEHDDPPDSEAGPCQQGAPAEHADVGSPSLLNTPRTPAVRFQDEKQENIELTSN